MNRLDVLAGVFGGIYALYTLGHLSFETTAIAYLFFIAMGAAKIEAELADGGDS